LGTRVDPKRFARVAALRDDMFESLLMLGELLSGLDGIAAAKTS
jgi:hypothetical protein